MVRPLAPEITSGTPRPAPGRRGFSIRLLSADSECCFSLRALHMRDCFSLLPPLPLASTVRGAAASDAEKSGSSRWPPRSPRRCGSNRSKCTVRVVGTGPPGRRAGDSSDLRDGRESSGLTATAKLCLSARRGWCGGRRGSGPGCAAGGAAAVGVPAARPAARRCPGRRRHERPLQVQLAWWLLLP